MEVKEKITEIISRITEENICIINDDEPLIHQLNLDSINVLTFVVEMETTFNISLEIEHIMEYTMNDLKETIRKNE